MMIVLLLSILMFNHLMFTSSTNVVVVEESFVKTVTATGGNHWTWDGVREVRRSL